MKDTIGYHKKSLFFHFCIIFIFFAAISLVIYLLSVDFSKGSGNSYKFILLNFIFNLFISAIAAFALGYLFVFSKNNDKIPGSENLFDSLTSLINRRSFMNSLMHESKRAKRYHYNIGLIICDIDNFKDINSKYSRDIGDIVLKDISAVIKTTLRRHDLVCRWGIDEFMIMLPETDMEGTRITAEKIRQKISEYVVLIKNYNIKCTVSLGTGLFSDEMIHYNEAITSVTDKLLEAKKDGKNNVK